MNDGVQRRAVNVTASMQDKAEALSRDGDETEMASCENDCEYKRSIGVAD